MTFSPLDDFTGESQRAEQRRLLNQQAAEIIAAHRRHQRDKRKEPVPPLPTLSQVARLEHVDTGPISATPRIRSDRIFHALNMSACNPIPIPHKVIDVHRIDDAIVQAIEGQLCSLPTPRGPARPSHAPWTLV